MNDVGFHPKQIGGNVQAPYQSKLERMEVKEVEREDECYDVQVTSTIKDTILPSSSVLKGVIKSKGETSMRNWMNSVSKVFKSQVNQSSKFSQVKSAASAQGSAECGIDTKSVEKMFVGIKNGAFEIVPSRIVSTRCMAYQLKTKP